MIEVILLFLCSELRPGGQGSLVSSLEVWSLIGLVVIDVLLEHCIKVNVLKEHLDLFNLTSIIMNVLFQLLLLQSEGVHHFSEVGLFDALIQKVVVRDKDSILFLRHNGGTVSIG